MRKLTLAIVVIGLVVAAAPANALKGCSIEGTWFGSNELGEHFVHTIIKTGAGRYKSVGQSPALGPDQINTPGLVAPFHGVHGELVKKGPRKYSSTWMLTWMVDSAIYGLPLAAIVPYGDVKMTSCNRWKATFGADVYLFDYGQDPFEDGILLDSLEPFKASYWRLRQYPGE